MREVEWVDFSDEQDRTVRLALDRMSHLPLRTIAITPNEEMHDKDEDVTIYSNYQEMQGITTAMQVTREHNGRRTHQIFYTSCTNAPQSAGGFLHGRVTGEEVQGIRAQSQGTELAKSWSSEFEQVVFLVKVSILPTMATPI